MSVKKTYMLEKQNLEECLYKEAPVSILRSDSEPREYEPTWGNMKKMVVYLNEENSDFEIQVEELDIPYEVADESTGNREAVPPDCENTSPPDEPSQQTQNANQRQNNEILENNPSAENAITEEGDNMCTGVSNVDSYVIDGTGFPPTVGQQPENSSGTRKQDALGKIRDHAGVNNLLIPEVQEYYSSMKQIINNKYGSRSANIFPDDDQLRYEEGWSEDEDINTCISEDEANVDGTLSTNLY